MYVYKEKYFLYYFGTMKNKFCENGCSERDCFVIAIKYGAALVSNHKTKEDFVFRFILIVFE